MDSIEIQKLMLDKGINKKTMAERCGWSPSNFGNKLKRSGEWPLEDLKKVAAALGMTLQLAFVPNEPDTNGEQKESSNE